jgi:hypothetical protein
MSSSIGQNPNLLLSARCDEYIVVDDCNLDENSLQVGKWQLLQHNLYYYNPPKHLQGMTNNVGLTFSVGDTIARFTISSELDH